MTIVLAIRHGETTWNVEKRCQGQTDIPLNDQGLQEAKLLGDALAQVNFGRVFSSDLQRAYDSIRLGLEAAGIDKTIQPLPGLREVQFGSLEGGSFREAAVKNLFDAWWASKVEDPSPIEGSETKQEFIDRLWRVLEFIEHESNGEPVIIASHGGVLRQMMLLANAEDMDPTQIAKCKPYEFRLEGRSLEFIK